MSSLGWGTTRSPKWDRFRSHVFFFVTTKKGTASWDRFRSRIPAPSLSPLLCQRCPPRAPSIKDARQRARHRATRIVAALAFSNRSPTSPATGGLCAATAGFPAEGSLNCSRRTLRTYCDEGAKPFSIFFASTHQAVRADARNRFPAVTQLSLGDVALPRRATAARCGGRAVCQCFTIVVIVTAFCDDAYAGLGQCVARKNCRQICTTVRCGQDPNCNALGAF
jgi:hypothetical protein